MPGPGWRLHCKRTCPLQRGQVRAKMRDSSTDGAVIPPGTRVPAELSEAEHAYNEGDFPESIDRIRILSSVQASVGGMEMGCILFRFARLALSK